MAEYLSPLDALSRQMQSTPSTSKLYNNQSIYDRQEKANKRREDLLNPPATYNNPPMADPKDALLADAKQSIASGDSFLASLDQQPAQSVTPATWQGTDPKLLRRLGSLPAPKVFGKEELYQNVTRPIASKAWNTIKPAFRPDWLNNPTIQGLILALQKKTPYAG